MAGRSYNSGRSKIYARSTRMSQFPPHFLNFTTSGKKSKLVVG